MLKNENQNTHIWKDARTFRVTANKVSSIPKRADPMKLVTNHIYNTFKGCTATRHGKNVSH